MNEILEKMKQALDENQNSISLVEVYGKERADSIGDKIDIMMRMAEDGRLYDTFGGQINRYKRYQLDENEAEWVMAFSRTYSHLQEVWAKKFARDGAEFMQEVLPEILKDITGIDSKVDIREIPKGMAKALKRLDEEDQARNKKDNSEDMDNLLNIFDEAKASAKKAGLKTSEDEHPLKEEGE